MTISCPLVSVIIPTYNRKDLVYRAVTSVLEQTYQHIECIVVDDCSTDGTGDLLAPLVQKDKRLRVIRHLENQHASAARNTGINSSQGELVAFLDDDDTWLPEKLQKQVSCLIKASSKVGLVYCWFDIYKGKEVIGTRRPKLRGNVFEKLLVSQPLGNASTLLVRREVIRKIGGFDEALPRGNDGDFIRRVSQYYEVEVLAEVLVSYFVEHGGNPRITGSNPTSILNGIRGHEAKLEKFSKELAARPKQHAELLATIAVQYARIGDISSAKSYLISAIRYYPISIAVYLGVLRSIANYFRRSFA